jgi:predicted DNA-binding WGR domain protein
MTALRIKLAASSPDHRCHRAYEIAVNADLFGAWLVEMRYGRIGTAGREKVRSFSTAEDAGAQVTPACASGPVRLAGLASLIAYTGWIVPRRGFSPVWMSGCLSGSVGAHPGAGAKRSLPDYQPVPNSSFIAACPVLRWVPGNASGSTGSRCVR